jgi:hypothetical protein
MWLAFHGRIRVWLFCRQYTQYFFNFWRVARAGAGRPRARALFDALKKKRSKYFEKMEIFSYICHVASDIM